MKLIAGLGYDSRKPNVTHAQFDTQIVGEEGLLRELEFRAGITLKNQSHVERVVGYMTAVKDTDAPQRFFHLSFKTDPLASAKELLHWRDWLMLHGWRLLPESISHGRLPESISHERLPESISHGRLADLAAIEQALSDLSPCVGERIIAVLQRVELVTAAIDAIILHHPTNHWPPLYQYLLEQLGSAGVKVLFISRQPKVNANINSDLGKLQQALLDNSTSKLALSNDGSLRCYRSDNIQTAANYVTHSLGDGHLVIASGQHFALNTAAAHAGFTEPGLGESSAWRTPVQLLPLLLQCMWSPPSAQTILQYLTLPTGKYKRLRQRLAKHFADLPGYDPALWQDVVTDYINTLVAHKPAIDSAKYAADIDKWLPIGHAGNNKNMPCSQAIELCHLVSQYWLARATSDHDPDGKNIMLIAHQAASALAQALGSWPAATINKDQLNRLLDLASDAGNGDYRHKRQVGQLNVVETAEAAALYDGEIAHLLWWDCRLNDEPKIPPLSKAELSGVPFAPTARALAQQTQTRLQRSLKALLAATSSVTVVALNDQPDLLQLTISQLTGTDDWQSLDSALLNRAIVEVPTLMMQDLRFPAAERWWQLAPEIPSPRATESFTSLAALALKPHEYVLKYSAKLNEGTLMSLPVDARLKGNLAHKIIESWLDIHPWTGQAPTQMTIDQWLANTLDDIILRTALPLEAPGMRAAKMQFKTQISHAMARLFTQLQNGGIKTIRVEHPLSQQLRAMALEGTIDLLCQLGDGRWVIVDLKWGGDKRYHDELKQNQPLQLATYAHLVNTISQQQMVDLSINIVQTWQNAAAEVKQNLHKAQVQQWINDSMADMLPSQPLPLIAAALDNFKTDICDKILLVQKLLAAEGEGTITFEVAIFSGPHQIRHATFSSRLDILLRKDDHKGAIMDVKWYYPKVPVYSTPINQSELIADVAYFIISKATLLTTRADIFTGDGVNTIEPEQPTLNIHHIWTQFARTFSWRLKQLQLGKVEITNNAIGPCEYSKPPVNTLPVLKMQTAKQAQQKKSAGDYKATFKPIDSWRIVAGDIKE